MNDTVNTPEAVTAEPVADQAATDQAATDQAATDQAATDRAATDQAATDQAAIDQAAIDQAATDHADTDHAATDQAAADAVAPEAATLGSKRTRRPRDEKLALDVKVAEKALASALAAQESYALEQEALAADTRVLRSGREFVGELLQNALIAGDAQALAMWDTLQHSVRGKSRNSRMETMREIMERWRTPVQATPESPRALPPPDVASPAQPDAAK